MTSIADKNEAAPNGTTSETNNEEVDDTEEVETVEYDEEEVDDNEINENVDDDEDFDEVEWETEDEVDYDWAPDASRLTTTILKENVRKIAEMQESARIQQKEMESIKAENKLLRTNNAYLAEKKESLNLLDAKVELLMDHIRELTDEIMAKDKENRSLKLRIKCEGLLLKEPSSGFL
jgi:hypothetical protein